jgi:hypothetical protein
MRERRMPGFTAEVSLYERGRIFIATNLQLQSSGVVPQRVCDADCIEGCLNSCPYPGEAPPRAIIACRTACMRECCHP